MREMYTFIRDFHEEVPGASAKDCGNYLDMNLGMANWLAKRYLDEVLTNISEDYESRDIVPLMREMYTFIRDFHEEVPGASAKDCGNYLDMNLGMANWLAKRYLDEVLTNISEDRLVYPE